MSVFGAPESAAEQIREIRDLLRPDVMLWQLDFGQQPRAAMERTLRLFAERVRPRLDETERP
nr:hypothetical protein [Streptomyces sp. S1D4-11]